MFSLRFVELIQNGGFSGLWYVSYIPCFDYNNYYTHLYIVITLHVTYDTPRRA